MATIKLLKHSVTLQDCLEQCCMEMFFDADDRSISVLVSRIAQFAVTNPDLFLNHSNLTLDSKPFDKTISEKIYSSSVGAEVKSELINSAKKRMFGDGKKDKNLKGKDLLEKQIRYVLMVFFAKKMKLPS